MLKNTKHLFKKCNCQADSGS